MANNVGQIPLKIKTTISTVGLSDEAKFKSVMAQLNDACRQTLDIAELVYKPALKEAGVTLSDSDQQVLDRLKLTLSDP